MECNDDQHCRHARFLGDGTACGQSNSQCSQENDEQAEAQPRHRTADTNHVVVTGHQGTSRGNDGHFAAWESICRSGHAGREGNRLPLGHKLTDFIHTTHLSDDVDTVQPHRQEMIFDAGGERDEGLGRHESGQGRSEPEPGKMLVLLVCHRRPLLAEGPIP